MHKEFTMPGAKHQISETKAGLSQVEQLEEANARYQAMIDSMSEGLLIASTDGEILFANERLAKMSGYSIEELLGSKVQELLVAEKDKPKLFQRLANRENDISEHYEFLYTRKDESSFWASINASPYRDSNGNIIGSIALVRDITEQRSKDEQLRSTSLRLAALIENMRVGILVENEHRKIALTNDVFCEMFDIDAEPSQLIGYDCVKAAEESKSLFSKPNEFIKEVEQILEAKVPVTGQELLLADGRVFERDYIPVFFEDRYLGHLWQYRDITRLRGKHQELTEALSRAEEAQKAEESFLANMSHELRTPLNGLVGMTNLLSRTDVSPEQKDFLGAIKSSADTLMVIINDILDFSKIQKGEVKFDNMPLALRPFIDNVMFTVKPLTDEKNIKLIGDISDDLPEHVLADASRLNQILINLLNNAIRFTDEGIVKLKVDVAGISDEAVSLNIAVEDTGMGIDKANQKVIFERFKQANNNQATEHRGTGLGLPIVKQLLKLQDSDIHVKSDKGKGSIFYFNITFPIQHHEVNGNSANTNSSEADLEEFKGARILVVEDNILNQKVAANFMEKWGFVADLAENGKVAVEMLEKNEFDLVLMDIQMPVMDGLEACIYIRKEMEDHDIPVLALTASVLSSNKDKILAAGMNDFIPKPFEPDMLLDKILYHLKHKERKSVMIDSSSAQRIPVTDSYVDLDFLYQNSFGNKEFMAEMVELFINETPRVLVRLKDQLENGDWDALGKEAHKFKSSLSLMGVHLLSETIAKIERIAKEEIGLEELPELLSDVTLVSHKAIEELEMKLKSLS